MASSKSTKSGFSDAEREAMKERAEELRAEGRGGKKKAEDAHALLEKIAEMPDEDRTLAEKIHAIVTETAPDLVPRTWYGMPAYSKDGDVLLFFKNASKFKARYATLGFSDKAALDKGSMWPVYYALTKITATVEKELRALVKQAIS